MAGASLAGEAAADHCCSTASTAGVVGIQSLNRLITSVKFSVESPLLAPSQRVATVGV